MRHSTISDLFLLHLKRASETQNHLTLSYWVPEHQGTGYFMRSECMKLVLVSFTLIYTLLSAACALISVCAGYMCFVKLSSFNGVFLTVHYGIRFPYPFRLQKIGTGR